MWWNEPEDFRQESQEAAASGSAQGDIQTGAKEEVDGEEPAAAAAVATEHSDQTTSLPDEKQLIYSIVNAFLNNMTFHYPQAEEVLVTALNDEACLSQSIC